MKLATQLTFGGVNKKVRSNNVNKSWISGLLIVCFIGVVLPGAGLYAKEAHLEHYENGIKTFNEQNGESSIKKAVGHFEKAVEEYKKGSKEPGKQLGVYLSTLSELYILLSQYDKAAKALEEASVILEKFWDPAGEKLSAIYYELGMLLLETEEYKKAASFFEKAAQGYASLLQKDEDTEDAFFKLARITVIWKQLLDREFVTTSITFKDKVQNENLGTIHIVIAGEYYSKNAKGNVDMILYHTNEAIRLNPGQAEYYNLLGIAYDVSGDFEKSLAAYEKAVELNPKNGTAYYNMACSYSVQKNKEKSLEFLKKSVDNGFRDYETMKSDASLTLVRGDKIFKELLESIKPPETPRHYEDFRKAGTEWERGRTDQAIKQVEKVIKTCEGNDKDRCPEYMGLYYATMGNYLYNKKMKQEAVDFWIKSNARLKETEGDWRYLMASNYTFLGMVYLADGADDEAIASYEQALENIFSYKTDNTLNDNEKKSVEQLIFYVIIEMGKLYDEIGEKSSYKLSADKLNKEYSKYEMYVSTYYIKKEDLVLALYHANRATELDPKNYMALNVTGVVYDYSKEYDKALALFEQARKLAPESSSVIYNIACNYAWRNQGDQAIAYLTEAIEKGYSNYDNMAEDEAFKSLKDNAEFKELLELVKFRGILNELKNKNDE